MWRFRDVVFLTLILTAFSIAASAQTTAIPIQPQAGTPVTITIGTANVTGLIVPGPTGAPMIVASGTGVVVSMAVLTSLTFEAVEEGAIRIEGAAEPDAIVTLMVNGQSRGQTTADSLGAFRLDTAPIQLNDFIQLIQTKGIGYQRLNVPVLDRADPTQGHPVGLTIGGAVLSQQVEEFSQADPFFGFITGYTSRSFGALDKETGTVAMRNRVTGNRVRKNSAGQWVEYIKVADQWVEARIEKGRWVAARGGMGAIAPPAAVQPVLGKGRLSIRFEGIFTATPRTAGCATATGATTASLNAPGCTVVAAAGTSAPATSPSDGSPTMPDFQQFISSRKTFDTAAQIYYAFPLSQMWSFGGFASWGASTALDRQELQTEAIQVQATGSSAAASAPGGTVSVASGTSGSAAVASRVRADNDIKQFREVGFVNEFLLPNTKLFVQNIMAYGVYEGLRNLVPNKDTSKRFIARLRVFPDGLDRGFGRQTRFAPMFGIDINAGRGPDHLRFFTGFAVRLKGL